MGAVDTTYTFTATDTITSTKMNNIIDQTTMTSDAVTGTTLEVVSGKLKVKTITSSEMGSGSVTSSAIDSNGPKWAGNYTDVGSGTASNPYYLSIAPNRTGNGDTVVQLGSAVGNNSSAFLYRSSGTNGSFTIENSGTGNIFINNPNGFTHIGGPNGLNLYKDPSNNANFPVPSGTAPLYGARAFINFNGGGTIASRWSGNVSSLVDNGLGTYTINFTVSMPDANFSTVVTSGTNERICQTIASPTTGSSVQVIMSLSYESPPIRQDQGIVCVSIFR